MIFDKFAPTNPLAYVLRDSPMTPPRSTWNESTHDLWAFLVQVALWRNLLPLLSTRIRHRLSHSILTCSYPRRQATSDEPHRPNNRSLPHAAAVSKFFRAHADLVHRLQQSTGIPRIATHAQTWDLNECQEVGETARKSLRRPTYFVPGSVPESLENIFDLMYHFVNSLSTLVLLINVVSEKFRARKDPEDPSLSQFIEGSSAGEWRGWSYLTADVRWAKAVSTWTIAGPVSHGIGTGRRNKYFCARTASVDVEWMKNRQPLLSEVRCFTMQVLWTKLSLMNV